MISRLISALIQCVIVLVVAWIVTLVLGVIPLGPVSGVIDTVVWAIAGLICLVLLLNIFFPGSIWPRTRP